MWLVMLLMVKKLEILLEVNYDLVLLDINMPIMDGYQTCEVMRGHDRLKEIPVIFLTAYAELESLLKGFEIGGQDYIVKPYNAKELLVRVNTQLLLKHKTDYIRNLNHELEEKVNQRTFELQQANRALSEVDMMKTEFLTYIIQEIRSPLNGIAGAVNLIKNQEFSSTIKSLVSILDKSVAKLESFTDYIIFFTQLSGDYPLKISAVNVNDIFPFCFMECDEMLKEKNISYEICSQISDFSIRADKDLIYNAFVNTLQNLIKLSQHHSKIWVDISGDENTLNTSIYNFDKTSDQSTKQKTAPQDKQSELIFSIVKQIINLHNGKVTIEQNSSGYKINISLNR